MPRTPSSRRWLQEHHTDPFVQKARAEGLRSRAAFKLMDLDRRLHLLRAGSRVVDLGAAPGGWSQWAVQRIGPRGRVVAVDILPMTPVEGVTFIQGDFREEAVRASVRAALGGNCADLVLSDMAPNLSGIPAVDQARSIELAELALELAREALAPGGAFLVKVFQGEGLEAYLRDLRRGFAGVERRKPEASRARSRELYVLARGYAGV
jgi:23S rRNA (uridine2552-2'-O)-methyltransferase